MHVFHGQATSTVLELCELYTKNKFFLSFDLFKVQTLLIVIFTVYIKQYPYSFVRFVQSAGAGYKFINLGYR